ncbi:hypothetical protein scyTo_0009061 [Scyliorhinus torazame]|uniref:Parathyroid hormone n=1 Tax=Scyliorhinus torazame TaxID=75743 RepID=A0A401PGG2_SCYTO|nr:hypothetical protein [Scyliorhinus torazame]
MTLPKRRFAPCDVMEKVLIKGKSSAPPAERVDIGAGACARTRIAHFRIRLEPFWVKFPFRGELLDNTESSRDLANSASRCLAEQSEMWSSRRWFRQLNWAILLFCCSVPANSKPLDGLSTIQKRSVSEHQFMHDRSRAMQELQRRIWLHNVIGELHTAEGGRAARQRAAGRDSPELARQEERQEEESRQEQPAQSAQSPGGEELQAARTLRRFRGEGPGQPSPVPAAPHRHPGPLVEPRRQPVDRTFRQVCYPGKTEKKYFAVFCICDHN